MVSMITAAELLDYVREDNPDEVAVGQIEQMKKAAVGYIMAYTGQSAEYLDEHRYVRQPFADSRQRQAESVRHIGA